MAGEVIWVYGEPKPTTQTDNATVPWAYGAPYAYFKEAEAPPAGQPYISRVQRIPGMKTWGGIR